MRWASESDFDRCIGMAFFAWLGLASVSMVLPAWCDGIGLCRSTRSASWSSGNSNTTSVSPRQGLERRTSKQPRTPADDPFGGRHPTSHKRMTGLPWDASYRNDGLAPWDIGHPQPAIVRLASREAFTGVVLDAGCGTGEHALHAASLGLPVLGVDETALAIARGKAKDSGVLAIQ